MKGALFHCLGYPRHQRPQFEGFFVRAAMSGTFRGRKVRIPEVYVGKENTKTLPSLTVEGTPIAV